MNIINCMGAPIIFRDHQDNITAVNPEPGFKPVVPTIYHRKNGYVTNSENKYRIPVYQRYLIEKEWLNTRRIPDPKPDTIYVINCIYDQYSDIVCDTSREDVFIVPEKGVDVFDKYQMYRAMSQIDSRLIDFYHSTESDDKSDDDLYISDTFLNCINMCIPHYNVVQSVAINDILNVRNIVNLCNRSFNFVDDNNNLIIRVEPNEKLMIADPRKKHYFTDWRTSVEIDNVEFLLASRIIFEPSHLDIPSERPDTIYLVSYEQASDQRLFSVFKDRNDLFIPIKIKINKDDGSTIIKTILERNDYYAKDLGMVSLLDGSNTANAIMSAYRLEIEKKKII